MTEIKIAKKTERHDSRVRCISPNIGANAMSNLSRRTLVSSAAALPALTVPAVAISADPIFAKIDRCKALFAEYGDFCQREPENLNCKEHDAWEEAQEPTHD
ncbi:MAG: hypothetical protein WAL37_10445, partial [Xanthobacteraceae bacterium]